MADMETAWRIHAVANAPTYNEAYAAYMGHAGVKGVGIEEFKRWTEANRPRIERLHDTPDGHALKLRFQLCSEAVADRIGRCLAWLFSRWVWPLALLVALGLSLSLGLESASVAGAQSWLAAVIAVVGIFIHELGHISACVRHRGHQGGIGVGIYWIWPAFYADVRGSWSLTRSARLQVSAGGLYFQFLYLAVLSCVSWATSSATMSMAVHITMLLMVTTCNPIFKYDGYWILTDLFGITNLHARVVEHVRSILRGSAPSSQSGSSLVASCMCATFVISAAGYVTFIWFELGSALIWMAHAAVEDMRGMGSFQDGLDAGTSFHLIGMTLQIGVVTVALVVLAARSLKAVFGIFAGEGVR
jgi:hypothetical protein